MPIKSKPLGYTYALIATFLLANVYIFSKAALLEVHLFTFAFYWFGFAVIWNLLFSASTGKFRKINSLSKFQSFNLLGIGLIEVIATASIFIAIDKIPNPTIPAMIRNLEPVIITLLAIYFLKEKHSKLEKTGILITILGTLLIAYNKNSSLNDFFTPGIEFVIISSIFFSIRTIWSKKVITRFTAHSLNLNKVSFMFIVSAIALLIANKSLIISRSALINILIGSLIGPFLTSYTQFLSLKYINASTSTLIQSTTGFITMVLAYFYWGNLPFTYQILGGLISILGIIALTYKPNHRHT